MEASACCEPELFPYPCLDQASGQSLGGCFGGVFSCLAGGVVAGASRNLGFLVATPTSGVPASSSSASVDGDRTFHRLVLRGMALAFRLMQTASPLSRVGSLLARAGILLLALVLAILVYQRLHHFPRTEDAEIRANVVGIAPQVGGQITRIHVRDNEMVEKGQLLFELDARPYVAEADRAAAQLELVRLEIQALEESIQEAEAAVLEKEARATYAADHFKRLQPLFEQKFISADRLQKAEVEAASQLAKLQESRSALARARSALGEIAGENMRLAAAEAALRDARLRVEFCRIYAPCRGIVTNLQISPGSYAATGEQIFALVDPSQWFVLANFRETDLRKIRPGQSVQVYLMGHSGKPLLGQVEGIASAIYSLADPSRTAPAGEGVFSQVQPTFDFIQLAARFPVRIKLQPDTEVTLRMGGKAAVIVNTRSGDSAPEL